jgi:hypothetical protein
MSAGILVYCADINNLSCGGVAQLGARLNGIQKVSGSIPLISTSKFKGLALFGVNPFLV